MPIHVPQMELLGYKTVCAVVLTGVPRLYSDVRKWSKTAGPSHAEPFAGPEGQLDIWQATQTQND